MNPEVSRRLGRAMYYAPLTAEQWKKFTALAAQAKTFDALDAEVLIYILAAEQKQTSLESKALSLKYSPDQPRDELGRFGETDGGSNAPIKLEKFPTNIVTPFNADELLWDPAFQEIDARVAAGGYKSNYGKTWREDYSGEIASTVKEFVARDITLNMMHVPVDDMVAATGLANDVDVSYALQSVPDGYVWGGTDYEGDEDFQLIALTGNGEVKAESASDVLDLSAYSKDGWNKDNVLEAMAKVNAESIGESGWALQGTQEAEDIVREAAVSRLVNQWAQTSNDGSPMSLAMQEIAAQEFGIENHASWETDDEIGSLVREYVQEDGPVYSAFLRAQYDNTQAFLNEQGVEAITMYRGMKELSDSVMAEAKASHNQDMSFRPLTSFSMNEATAFNFAGNHYEGITLENALVLRSDIPAERILSLPITGLGCLREEEAVILGGDINVDVVTAKDYFANQQAKKDGWA